MKNKEIKKSKAKFFAQYYGVKCMYVGGVGLVEVGIGGWNISHPDFFLKLKSLSKMSDNDAISYIDFCERLGADLVYDKNKVESKIEIAKWRVDGCFEQLSLYDFDYLRSKGYAMPFMDFTVKKQVELGWVKII